MTLPPNITVPTFTLDIEYYEHYLENSDACDEEKRALLEALWKLICEFVVLGYEVHPLQQVIAEKDKPKGDTIRAILYHQQTQLKC